MHSLRRWFYRPKKEDSSKLAQFYWADEELNMVAAELDSFDGRKDPERCSSLVNQLRLCQDKVLNICSQIMDEAISDARANRDFQSKFPDDVLQENLSGQLWFGAECLAAGSNILNREAESAHMRPLAKALTRALDNVRFLLREQCLRNPNEYTDKVKESLWVFDRLFADFELCYVSAMVPVKSALEFHLQQEVIVLFSETLLRALRLGLVTQDLVDYCDPSLMFTIPRLAIVCGLLVFPDGPLQVDKSPDDMSELFRPFFSLLYKIRDLLWTLSEDELYILEKTLCSLEDPEIVLAQMRTSSKALANSKFSSFLLPSSSNRDAENKRLSNCKQFIQDFYIYNFGMTTMQDESEEIRMSNLDGQMSEVETRVLSRHILSAVAHRLGASRLPSEEESQLCGSEPRISETISQSLPAHSSITASSKTIKEPCRTKRSLSLVSDGGERVLLPVRVSRLKRDSSEYPLQPCISKTNSVTSSLSPCSSIASFDWEQPDSEHSSETSSYRSECQDDQEIALALQAAEIASCHKARARFKDSTDLIHRLFVCISGVADQLQTNFAGDLRNILKCVFEMNSSLSPLEDESKLPNAVNSENGQEDFEEQLNNNNYSRRLFSQNMDLLEDQEILVEFAEEAENANEGVTSNLVETGDAPCWLPDDFVDACMSCRIPFTLIRRRHHCRNCGKIFCARCSSNSVPLPRFGHTKAVRVCNSCFVCQVTHLLAQQIS